jgi:acyl-ACP thioesterase
MLQETAWLHARLLGKGFAERSTGGLFWVLSRLRLQMERYPRWGDTFSITTWPVGTYRLFGIREFSLRDDSGHIGRAKSGWLVVDGGTGRPVRPERVVSDIPTLPSEFDAALDRLAEPEAPVDGPTGVVQHHDIDQYRHVNQAAYLEWVLDALSAGQVASTERPAAGVAVEISVDYLKELVLGEKYQTLIADNGAATCDVIRLPDREAMCRARLKWKAV